MKPITFPLHGNHNSAQKGIVLSSITFYSNVNLGPMSGTFFFL
ncbi:hypothetical protein DORFOR_03307 [Dorea formicigenerans ATCC 27755]|uniref:Uncharacterized protein n=1 Tax=Dorea formicigenerans ATCC 27755 TaxID=411461 RepID=B0GAJ1_9FIRM|nr:hypothetical protein DORFOR_03307 [Dorea formicigenerans ATCC 27755]